MQGASPDPFVLEMRELARLIALAREWVLRGPAVAHGEIRARRTVVAGFGRGSLRDAATQPVP